MYSTHLSLRRLANVRIALFVLPLLLSSFLFAQSGCSVVANAVPLMAGHHRYSGTLLQEKPDLLPSAGRTLREIKEIPKTGRHALE